MSNFDIDPDRLISTLKQLVNIPSPTGYTSPIVQTVCERLKSLGLDVRRTRRGAVHAVLEGRTPGGRAIAAHLDTLGAMVSGIEEDGRVKLVPVGTWSARFAEGARVTVLGSTKVRGTVLPPKSSGHIFDDAVDTAPIGWDAVRLRLDLDAGSADDVRRAGVDVGDFVAFDPGFERVDGWLVSRHLDDAAGVACVLEALEAVRDRDVATDIHLWFTVFEEVGAGATALLDPNVDEFLAVDLAPVGPGQQSSERAITIPALDASGPFDRGMVDRLFELAARHELPARRDVFHHYRSDTASAVLSGNDVRVALACYGLDASHGYERTHVDGLVALASLIAAYIDTE